MANRSKVLLIIVSSYLHTIPTLKLPSTLQCSGVINIKKNETILLHNKCHYWPRLVFTLLLQLVPC